MYRRAPGLVVYWHGTTLVARARTMPRAVPVPADVLAVLDTLTDWRDIGDLAASDDDLDDAAHLLRSLHELGLVQRHDDRPPSAAWDGWEPEASFFHAATRDVPYPADRADAEAWLAKRASLLPPPPPTKRLAGARIRIPAATPTMTLAAALDGRRTWRTFHDDPVPLDALGAVLDRTFRVQRWGTTGYQPAIPLKTSPSAGGRHPVEAYLLAWHVDGLDAGVYHFDAADGALVRLREGLTGAEVGRLLGHQAYYARAGAAVVMTACIERVTWKYPFARAYRAVLIDAGHLGQTFCLMATAAGLAPFCTMAFSDSGLEALLQVDGQQEPAMFVVGVGTRPADDATPSHIPD